MTRNEPTLLMLVLDRHTPYFGSPMHQFLCDYLSRLHAIFGKHLQLVMVNRFITGPVFMDLPARITEPKNQLYDCVPFAPLSIEADQIHAMIEQFSVRTPNYTDAIRDIREDIRIRKPTNVIMVSSFNHKYDGIGSDQRDWFQEANVLAVTLLLEQKQAAQDVFQSCEHLLYLNHVFTPDQFMFFVFGLENKS